MVSVPQVLEDLAGHQTVEYIAHLEQEAKRYKQYAAAAGRGNGWRRVVAGWWWQGVAVGWWFSEAKPWVGTG